MSTFEISIDGMSCGHCVKRVREAIQAVAGVASADVRVGSAAVTLKLGASPAEVLQAVRRAGYTARLEGEEATR